MTNKDTNSQDSIQVGNESIQTTTLGNIMEELKNKIIGKMIIDGWNEQSANEMASYLDLYSSVIMRNVLPQSKTDLLNSLIEREEKADGEYLKDPAEENGFWVAKQDTINHLKSLRDVA